MLKKVLRPYREVLSLPGSAAFTSSGFVARLPIAMEGLGIVLLVTSTRDSYALAGVLTAVAALAASGSQPFTSRLADRFGQRVMLPTLAVAHSVLLIAFVWAVAAAVPDAALGLIAILAGASMPAVGGMMRARWAYVAKSPAQVRTGFAIESLLDEVIFIVGPVLATFLALSIASSAPLLASAILVVSGAVPLTLQRRTQPPRAHHERARSPIPVPALAIIVVGMVCLGVIFGAIEIGYVAFADEAGQRGMTGALYAAYSAGSLLAGIVYGGLHLRWRLASQWIALAAGLAVATALLPIAGTIPWLLGLSFIAGLAVSPTLITGLTIVQRTMPTERLTEALSWALASIGVGMAAAAAVAGALVDQHGARAAFVVCAAGGAGTFVVTLAGMRGLRRAETRAAQVVPLVSSGD